MIASPLGGRVAGRRGCHVPMTAGLTLGGIGLLSWLLAGPSTSYPALIAPLMLTGFGMGFAMPATTMAIMDAAPARRGGAASAVFNTARQTGSAVGVALVGAMATSGLMTGLHTSAVVGGAAFGAAAVLTLAAITT